MSHKRSLALLLLIAPLLAVTVSLTSLVAAQTDSPTGMAQAGPEGVALNLSLETLVPAGALEGPVDITHAGDSRLFVVEREGRIRIVRPDGAVDPTPFLDIADRVRLEPGTEQGLLGLAFHPDYAQNGYFYVNYTAEPDGATNVVRFSVSADPDVADPGTDLLILEVSQPYTNHNAGDLVFGPQDGFLYIPLGDGGSGNDPQNRAQNMQVLLGKLLRIDVDQSGGSAADCGTPGNYTIPPDNPFVDGAGGDCDEIWALGLRNPWRASFDRQTADLYMGDVGQLDREEIDFQPASSTGGENYGWPCYEGTKEHLPQRPFCDQVTSFVMPIFEIDRTQEEGCAITGGYVYRGARYPEMQGRYFLSDLCAPYIWDLDNDAGTWLDTRHDNMQAQLGSIVSFGEGVDGELYLAKLNGAIYHLVEDTLITDFEADVLLPTFFK